MSEPTTALLESLEVDKALQGRLLNRGVNLLRVLRLLEKDGPKAIPVIKDVLDMLDHHGDDTLMILSDIISYVVDKKP